MQRYQRRICPKSNPHESAIHRRRCYNHFGKCEYHSFRSPNRWCFILKYATVWIQGGCNQISIAKEKYTFRFTRNVFFYDFENRKINGMNQLDKYEAHPKHYFKTRETVIAPDAQKYNFSSINNAFIYICEDVNLLSDGLNWPKG